MLAAHREKKVVTAAMKQRWIVHIFSDAPYLLTGMILLRDVFVRNRPCDLKAETATRRRIRGSVHCNRNAVKGGISLRATQLCADSKAVPNW